MGRMVPVGVLIGRPVPRCGAVDPHGKQCRCTTDLEPTQYHGDSEIYGSLTGTRYPGWVAVLLCKDHRDPPRRTREEWKRLREGKV